MADIVSTEQRSRIMSRIRGKNTKPELLIRKGIHRLGFRYRLHRNDLPGKPDLVFPKYRAVVLIHGCFWHGHDCQLFREPATNKEFWSLKIMANRENDVRKAAALESSGWRILTVWECSIRGKQKSVKEVVDRIAAWLLSSDGKSDIRG
jgi:DNA mismatch endonuclease (patch repair protein)